MSVLDAVYIINIYNIRNNISVLLLEDKQSKNTTQKKQVLDTTIRKNK
jgi:hypothetical protein